MKTRIEQKSVQSLYLQMLCRGQPLSNGTGFIVACPSGPFLVTNRHNLTGRVQDSGKPMHSSAGIPDAVLIMHHASLGGWESRIESLLGEDDRPLWREHPTFGPRADLVALPLTEIEGVKFFPYELADLGQSFAISPADPVSVIGFPFGMSASPQGVIAIWATGFLATDLDVDYDGLPVTLIDCRGRPGQSGSPVIAFRSGGMIRMENGDTNVFNGAVWRFIGVYSGRINDQSDLGMVWKSKALLELCAPNFGIR